MRHDVYSTQEPARMRHGMWEETSCITAGAGTTNGRAEEMRQ
jgi:hypothetical protein